MSAWIVSKEHIDLLVRAAIEVADGPEGWFGFRWHRVNADGSYAGWRNLNRNASGPADPTRYPAEYMVECSPGAAGQMLWNENIRSVDHRYSETNDAARYVYTDPGYTMTPGEVFKTIDCLDYQSCEHDGWETSEAYSFLRSLRDAYCRKSDGYEDAPWGWTAQDIKTRRAAA